MKSNFSRKREELNRFYFGEIFHSPGKVVVIIFVLVWLISTSLIVLSMTDLFQESFFNRRYTMIYLLLAGATISTIRICISYYRNRKQVWPHYAQQGWLLHIWETIHFAFCKVFESKLFDRSFHINFIYLSLRGCKQQLLNCVLVVQQAQCIGVIWRGDLT